MSKGAKKTSNDKRAKRIEKAIEILQKEKKYTSLGYIGSGSFGQVFRMIEPLNKSELAVKIVPCEMVSKAESELWKKMRHPNLVSLIGMHKLKREKTFVFLMPVYRSTLFDSIQDLNPCKGAYNIVKSWLKDVLQGLDYLHTNGACHLDLKPDNVLISDQNSALLCDFTFLRDCKTPLYKHDIGLPSIYRPPEVDLSKERKQLDGTGIDMWAFGCLVMELLSCFTLTNACMDGREQMYTTVLNLLEEYSLLRPIMINIFKGDDLCETDVKLALRFIKEFLTFEASHRLTACKALKHDFFLKNIEDNVKIGIKKKNDLILLKIIELRNEVKYLRIKLENIENSLENLMKRKSVDKMKDETVTKSTGELENRKNEINGEPIDKPIDSNRINTDGVAIVYKENTKVKKEKKKGRALNWMRAACRSVFSLFKKKGSN